MCKGVFKKKRKTFCFSVLYKKKGIRLKSGASAPLFFVLMQITLAGNQAFCLMRLTHYSKVKVFQLVAGEKQFTGLFFLLPTHENLHCRM